MSKEPKYRIMWDGTRAWQIERSRIVEKTGQIAWEPISYFGRIDHCCNHLLQLEAGRRSETMNIAQAFKEAAQFVKEELHRIGADTFDGGGK